MKVLDADASSILRVSPDRRGGWQDAEPGTASANAVRVFGIGARNVPGLVRGLLIQEKVMARTLFPAQCAVHGSSCRHRSPSADAVVVVVIVVLACVLSVYGLEVLSVLAVLGGAGLVAAGTLTAVRGGGRRLRGAVMRAANAVATG